MFKRAAWSAMICLFHVLAIELWSVKKSNKTINCEKQLREKGLIKAFEKFIKRQKAYRYLQAVLSANLTN